MNGFFRDLQQLIDEGEPFVLCTVIASHGSTPQKPGSKLVVKADGTLVGTVGGGAIEKQIVDAALGLLRSTVTTTTLDTHLTHELGMCCGGRMTVFLEKHAVDGEADPVGVVEAVPGEPVAGRRVQVVPLAQIRETRAVADDRDPDA